MNAPVKKVNTCAFCGTNVIHVIDPTTRANDSYARPVRTIQGSIVWKCGNCHDREFENSILKHAPDSPAARSIIAKRGREIEDQRRRIASLMKFHKLSGEKI